MKIKKQYLHEGAENHQSSGNAWWQHPESFQIVHLQYTWRLAIATQQLGTAILAVEIVSAVSNPQDIAKVKTFKLISNGLFDAWKPTATWELEESISSSNWLTLQL
jgi:hypothetical protein